MREPTSAYTADRAAALAGVPQSTLHYWAREGILTPSVSPDRVKLWSFANLMVLRAVEWLRRKKLFGKGSVPPTRMPEIRRALAALRKVDQSLWTEETGYAVLVDRTGQVLTRDPRTGTVAQPLGRAGHLQTVADEFLDVMAPFELVGVGFRGPDLRRPRPRLRIIPGKVAGAPHIESTRLETQAVHALARRGFEPRKIVQLYPFTDLEAINDAIALESELQRPAA
jgi:uncharacterized protein (DUF433 family)